jgi:hypothetical protein
MVLPAIPPPAATRRWGVRCLGAFPAGWQITLVYPARSVVECNKGDNPMKTAIILVLTLALAGVLWGTKPSKDDFKSFLMETRSKDQTNWVAKWLAENQVGDFADQCTYNNYVLWSTIKSPDGQTIYVGIASHWIPLSELDKVVEQLKQKVKT